MKQDSVLQYFSEISAIPRGSGNMEGISRYCVEFAEKQGLRVLSDAANNVIIFKEGSRGYEQASPVILQGHLDMVCQKEPDFDFDFTKDGLKLYTEGDWICAQGTTLGADNGIAVAMIMAILSDDEIEHPPLEAVFTTDEEIGMFGAIALDVNCLHGKKMINLDCGPDELTVSCAGGVDVKINVKTAYKKASGTKVTLMIKGLQGGHSGVEINSGRVNANVLAGRILNHYRTDEKIDIIDINGGDKGNVITPNCKLRLLVQQADNFLPELQSYLESVKSEIADREPNVSFDLLVEGEETCEVLEAKSRNTLITALACAPDGVQEMSASIAGLVETSLNLGVVQSSQENILLHFSLRSNKESAMQALKERMESYADFLGCTSEASGFYPPWEYRENTPLQTLYKKAYKEKFGYEPVVSAIHAGLECGLFANKIKDLDCIAVGPRAEAVHTVQERLSISSVHDMYVLLLQVLKECK